MSHLFTVVSAEQKEIVAGGFGEVAKVKQVLINKAYIRQFGLFNLAAVTQSNGAGGSADA